MRDNVLIVEDDPVLRAVAAEFLADAGICVMQAPTADAALDVLAAHEGEIAVVFTDVTMPGRLDGFALAAEVMTAWPNIKVIVTSGNSRLAPDRAPGISAFLPKPWLPLEMLANVVNALSAAQARP